MPASSSRRLIVGNRVRQELPAQVAGVEQHVVGPGGGHLPNYRVGDDVPRGQLRHLVHGGHEPAPVDVEQQRALAPHGLRDERELALGARPQPQDRRVELHELQVAQYGPGPERGGDPVSRRAGRVGRRPEHLPDPARRQHDGGRQHGADAVPRARAPHVQGHAAGAPCAGRVRFGRQHVQHQGVLHDLDARVVPHGLDLRDQRPGDLRARGVAAGVRDPVGVVAALPGERDVAVGRLVEDRPARHELAHARRPLGDQDLHRLGVGQATARGERVREVRLGRVGRVERGGDAALRPHRRPRQEPALRHQQHPRHVRAQLERRRQARDPRADDYRVGLGRPAGRRGGEGTCEARSWSGSGAHARPDAVRTRPACWNGSIARPLSSSPYPSGTCPGSSLISTMRFFSSTNTTFGRKVRASWSESMP